MKTIVCTALFIAASATAAAACGIQGTAYTAGGSKIDGTSAVSTSWNSKKAYPKNGRYRLDLGNGVCGQKITVYLDGRASREVRVDGWTEVNLVRK